MFQRLQNRRIIILTIALLLGFSGLAYRLADLQVFRHEELSRRAIINTQISLVHLPLRGEIRDRNGNVLATSIFVKKIIGDPVLIDGRQAEIARAIAPLLGMDEAKVAHRLRDQTITQADGSESTARYIVLKKKVPTENWVAIHQILQNMKLPPKAVFAEKGDNQYRLYPNQKLAAHVLGFVGQHEIEVNGAPRFLSAGAEGIELTLDKPLTGVSGWRVTELDRKDRELLTFRNEEVRPRDGLSVVLTLDSVIQLIVEEELARGCEKHTPISACAVVVRPRTGEILAMATLPNFDPGRPGDASADHRRNRMLTDIFEPGSTFKTMVVAGALDDGAVSLTDVFDCENGSFYFGGRTLHDHHPYGPLTVEGIITKSSNIGAAKIGMRMGSRRLQETILEFGFGTSTGVPLPGEMKGIVHPVKDWSGVTIAQIPMGHGIAVTRMQMVMAMSAIANDGLLMRPKLVDRLEDVSGAVVVQYSPQSVRQVVNSKAAQDTVQALITVPAPGGTAPLAAMDYHQGAGKTGTAQKAGRGGYMPGKFVASYIGFFPARNPEVCIGVFFDEPHNGYYGGVVAAPVFKQIAERVAAYLAVPANFASTSEGAPMANMKQWGDQ